MKKFGAILLQVVVFAVGALSGLVLVGSVDCTWMLIDATGRSTPGTMLTPEASVQILMNGGQNSNLCHLPYGTDVWIGPGTMLIIGNLLPTVFGIILVWMTRKALYGSKKPS
jgi:hypothetical protein